MGIVQLPILAFYSFLLSLAALKTDVLHSFLCQLYAYKANVIPGSASAVIDGRFIPGFEDELNETIKSIIGEHVTVETVTRDKALEVPFEGDLVEAMCAALIKHDGDGIPVPFTMSGGTDNKALSKIGIIGYGFSPLKLDPELDFMALFHGVDERVPISGLEFGVNVLADFLENC